MRGDVLDGRNAKVNADVASRATTAVGRMMAIAIADTPTLCIDPDQSIAARDSVRNLSQC